MTSDQHEDYIRATFALAEKAVSNGDEPFGALLVLDGQVEQMALNTVNTDNDQTHHAELNLIRDALRRMTAAELERSTLFTSTEPCAMCTGTIYAAGVPEIVYGCGAEALYALTGSDRSIPSREILALGRRKTTVTGPLLEEEGMLVHREFWTPPDPTK